LSQVIAKPVNTYQDVIHVKALPTTVRMSQPNIDVASISDIQVEYPYSYCKASQHTTRVPGTAAYDVFDTVLCLLKGPS